VSLQSRPADLLVDAARELADAGVRSPRVDAELLLADLLEVTRTKLLTIGAVPDPVVDEYRQRITRRAGREPLQYITGRAPFRHIELAVGPGVFVPRPETELLVDAVLPHLRAQHAPLVVDLCAGSGALALAVADEVPDAQVIAVEGVPAAARWLARNAEGTGVRVIVADVTDPEVLIDLYGTAAAVVANPPYVPSGTSVDPEVLSDPPDAVFAGPDGLAVVPAVIACAASLLTDGGVFAMEHDDTQGESVPALLAADGHWHDVADHRDLTGRPRFATARRFVATR
jgi:release factor glutamine methyltransferase